jgi:hypothetical protein
MPSSHDLEKRVQDLEAEVALLRKGRMWRGVRHRSAMGLGDIPFLAIATGPDPEKGEIRGHARGIIAIGDVATGFVAIGGLARGVFALGGLALGAVTFGGASIGILLAAGGLAIGGVAFGGGAIGGVAIGGGAFGQYACGGGAAGSFVVRPGRADPEAEAFFERHGLREICHSAKPRR